MLATKRLLNIKKLLFKPLPNGVLKYKFLFKKTKIHKLHNKASKLNEIKLIQPFKGLYNLYTYLFWFFYLGWILIWKNWRNRSKKLYQNKQISQVKQLVDLLNLTFVYTTPPSLYYQLNLYKYKSTLWYKFIFTNELPGWHKILSPNISLQTIKLLKNKSLFAKFYGEIGIPIISDVTILKGSIINYNELFKNESIFIKPVEGSGQKNNYPLYYNANTKEYKLAISNTKFLYNESEIIDFVNNLLKDNAYLFQPLLQNHPSIKELTTVDELITIRIITICKSGDFKTISALLEIPIKSNIKTYCVLPINLINGEVKPFEEDEFNLENFNSINFKLLKNFSIPFWEEINKMVLNAHQQIPDIFSIGWDVCITANGIRLIEGNINWGVVPHQKNGPELIEYFVE